MIFKANSFLDVIKHLFIMLVLLALLLAGFFYYYLPKTTNHGETISVPDITGMQVDELENFLEEKSLRYYINDSSYSPNLKPYSVITQEPKPGAKVKENRKIYISINMKNPPLIKMPRLIDGSVKNAQMILKSYGLEVGKIEYEPNLAQNAVLRQLVNGKEVEPGMPIPKGSKVDLVVGDGLGETEFDVPAVVGMPVDEATLLLAGQGLQLGSVLYDPNSSEPAGTVVRQRPTSGTIRAGEMVDIWVAGREPVSPIQ